jgi:hypothetical protein
MSSNINSTTPFSIALVKCLGFDPFGDIIHANQDVGLLMR